MRATAWRDRVLQPNVLHEHDEERDPHQAAQSRLPGDRSLQGHHHLRVQRAVLHRSTAARRHIRPLRRGLYAPGAGRRPGATGARGLGALPEARDLVAPRSAVVEHGDRTSGGNGRVGPHTGRAAFKRGILYGGPPQDAANGHGAGRHLYLRDGALSQIHRRVHHQRAGSGRAGNHDLIYAADVHRRRHLGGGSRQVRGLPYLRARLSLYHPQGAV